MINSLINYDEERDEFFLQEILNIDDMKKEEKISRLAMSYNDIYCDCDYETNEDEVQLKEIIEKGNKPNNIYLTYGQMVIVILSLF